VCGTGGRRPVTIEPGDGERGSAGRGPQDVDLVRTMALSSAELWHEILERLREVQESQARLASAIETLGGMVRDALAPDARPVLGAHSQRAPLAQVSGEQSAAPALSWMTASAPPASASEPPVGPPPTDAQSAWSGADAGVAMVAEASPDSTWTVVPEEPGGLLSDTPRRPRHAIGSASEGAAFHAGRWAAAGEPIDDILGFKTPPPAADTVTTGVETSAPGAQSGAAEVPEPLFATEVPEPLFYAAPPDEEILPAGSVADLTPSDLDAVLTAEFGAHRVQSNGQSPPTPPETVADATVAPAIPVVAAPSATPTVEVRAVEAPVVEAAPVDAPVAEAAPVEAPVFEAAPVEAPVFEALLGRAPVGEAGPVDTAVADHGTFAASPVFTAEPAFTGLVATTTPEGAAVAAEPGGPPVAVDSEGERTGRAPTVPTGRANVTDPNVVLDILLGARPTPEHWQSGAGPSTATAPPVSSVVSTVPPPAPVFEAAPDLVPPTPPQVFGAPPTAAPPGPPLFEAAPDPAPPGPTFFEAAPDPAPPGPTLFEAAPDPAPPGPPLFEAAPTPPSVTTAFATGALAPTRIPEPAAPPPPPVPPLPPAASTLPPFSPPEAGDPQMAVPPPPTAGVADPPVQAVEVDGASEALSPFVQSSVEELPDTLETGPFNSAASMATEILSVTPEIPTMAVPEEPAAELISKDVTLIARGRRKRFRLH